MNQRWRLSATKQAIRIKLALTVGFFFFFFYVTVTLQKLIWLDHFDCFFFFFFCKSSLASRYLLPRCQGRLNSLRLANPGDKSRALRWTYGSGEAVPAYVRQLRNCIDVPRANQIVCYRALKLDWHSLSQSNCLLSSSETGLTFSVAANQIVCYHLWNWIDILWANQIVCYRARWRLWPGTLTKRVTESLGIKITR